MKAYRIYLQSLAVGDSSLDSSQIISLELIALQTLAEGGDGVAMARSMLHLEIDDEFGTSFRNAVINSKSADQIINCYPNPVSNNMLVTRAFDSNSVYQISLMNSIGETIATEKFNTKNHLLKLGNFPPGSYIIKIVDQSKILYSRGICTIITIEK